VNLDCLENLTVQEFQEDQRVPDLQVVLVRHYVPADQLIQLQSHIKYKHYIL